MLRINTADGEIELTEEFDIRLYRHITAKNKLSAEDLHDQIRQRNVSAKLVKVLILQRIIDLNFITYALANGSITTETFFEFIPLRRVPDKTMADYFKAANFPVAEIKELYFAGDIKSAAIPLEKAIELAKLLHRELARNKVDPAAVPSYIVKLDDLYLAILEKIKMNYDDEIEEKCKELNISEQASAAEVLSIIRKSGTLLIDDIQILIEAIDAIVGDTKDIEKVAAMLHGNKLPECQRILQYINFARDYGAYYFSLKNYLLTLKNEAESVMFSRGMALRGSAVFSLFSAMSNHETMRTTAIDLHNLLRDLTDKMDVETAFETLSRVIDILAVKLQKNDEQVEQLRTSNLDKVAKLQFMPAPVRKNLLTVPMDHAMHRPSSPRLGRRSNAANPSLQTSPTVLSKFH